MKINELIHDISGMALEEARAIVRGAGFKFLVININELALEGPASIRNDRIKVKVTKGKIVDAFIG